MDNDTLLKPCMGMGTFPLQGDTLVSCLDQAVISGYSIIDTAYKYNNESIIGDYLSNHNQHGKILIQSKVSLTQLYEKKLFGLCYKRHTVEDALKETCKKLGAKCLDIYLMHGPYNCEYTYGELIKLRKKKLVKMIGGCRMEINHMENIYKRYGEYPTINQIEMHPYCSNLEIVEYCKSKNIIVEGRSPFAHGDLVQEFIIDEVLTAISKKYNKSIPQIILRWITQHGVIAIPRTSNPAHIIENSNIFDFEIRKEDQLLIDNLNRNQSVGCLSNNQVH